MHTPTLSPLWPAIVQVRQIGFALECRRTAECRIQEDAGTLEVYVFDTTCILYQMYVYTVTVQHRW